MKNNDLITENNKLLQENKVLATETINFKKTSEVKEIESLNTKLELLNERVDLLKTQNDVLKKENNRIFETPKAPKEQEKDKLGKYQYEGKKYD